MALSFQSFIAPQAPRNTISSTQEGQDVKNQPMATAIAREVLSTSNASETKKTLEFSSSVAYPWQKQNASEPRDDLDISLPAIIDTEASEKKLILAQKIADLYRAKNNLRCGNGSAGFSNKKMVNEAVSFHSPVDGKTITIAGNCDLELYIKLTQSILKSEWKKLNQFHETHLSSRGRVTQNEKNCIHCCVATAAWKKFTMDLKVNHSTMKKSKGIVFSFAEGIELLSKYLKKDKTLQIFEILTTKLKVPREELFAAYYGLKKPSESKVSFINSCEFIIFDHKDDARKEAVSLKIFEKVLLEIQDTDTSFWMLQGLFGQKDILETLQLAVGLNACRKIIAEFPLTEPFGEKLRLAVEQNWEEIMRKNKGYLSLLELLPEHLKKALFDTIYCLRGKQGELEATQDFFLENPTHPTIFKAIRLMFAHEKQTLPEESGQKKLSCFVKQFAVFTIALLNFYSLIENVFKFINYV